MTDQKHNPSIFTYQPVCPVSGLQIRRSPDWKIGTSDDDFIADICVIGSHILLSQASGFASLSSTIETLDLIQNMSQEVVGHDKPFIIIEDFSHLKGGSFRARRYYIDFMKRQSRLMGLFIIDAPLSLSIGYKIAVRMYHFHFHAQIAKNYEEAINLSVDLLTRKEILVTSPGIETKPDQMLHQAGTPYEVITDEQWSFRLEEFSVSFEIIDGHILHSRSTGYLKEEYIDKITELREKIKRQTGLSRGFEYLIANVMESQGASRRARRLFMESLKSWHQKWPIKAYIFYGVNNFIWAAVHLAQPFIPFKLKIAKNLDGALAMIEKEKSSDSVSISDPLEKGTDIKQYVDELLAFIGGINWETDGLDGEEQTDPNHPFSPVFESIKLIKGELDELFLEREKNRQNQVKLEAQLAQAQKLEAIGLLAGGVAHDLNNILSGIVSYPDFLLTEIPENSPMHEPMMTIKKSGERASAIVQDLMTLARRNVPVSKVENLNDIISDYLDSPEYRRLMIQHPAVILKTKLCADLKNVLGSRLHLSKIVMNLISNAAEAISDNGSIHVSTTNFLAELPISGFETIPEGDYVVLSIVDNGTGIPKEDLNHIFEPFYTKKIMGKSGSGLGMAIVWGCVKDHHGFIDIQSSKNNGTTVTLYLPVTDITNDETSPAFRIEEIMGHGESILVVDDLKEQRTIAVSILKRMGYRVVAVSSGEEAIAYIQSNPIDVVLLDMIMKTGMDGLETYRNIIRVNPHQKTIVVSGYADQDQLEEILRLGVNGYVRKPYKLEEIGTAVKNVIEGKPSLSVLSSQPSTA